MVVFCSANFEEMACNTDVSKAQHAIRARVLLLLPKAKCQQNLLEANEVQHCSKPKARRNVRSRRVGQHLHLQCSLSCMYDF